jgi:hypothetical protein
MLLSAIGCGGSSQEAELEEAARNVEQGAQAVQQAAEQMAGQGADSAEQMTQGLQQMAQGFQQMTTQASAPLVPFERLQALLPAVDGWAQSDARGEQQSMGAMSVSKAEAVYRQGDSRIDLEITDTALSQLLLAPMSMFLASGYSERSSEGFKRAAKIGASPGFEEWNSEARDGEVTAVVGNRFIVTARGRDVAGIEAVRGVVEAVDLDTLAGLK